MTPEGKILAGIIAYLKGQRRNGVVVWWLKLHGGPMQRAGVPDLLVVLMGESVFLEIKQPGGTVSRLQWATMERIREAGVRAMVVDSVIGAIDAIWRT